MSQDIRLYGEAQVWDQALQTGQVNLVQAIRDFWPVGINSVLDVGCGDGKLTARLADLGVPTMVGLDSSAEALSRLPFQGVLGDAQALPFPEAAFDLVMSTDALEHMPSAAEAAAWGELFRVASKAVLVAVPFREELLDATARCDECGDPYHVNWHQRRYDIVDLHRRAPAGWSVRTTVLAGEPWSARLPAETSFRRNALGEWSGWALAICPHCGCGGHAPTPEQPLPSLLAQVLAKQLYPVLAERRYCRSHSEILVIFERDNAELTLPSPCQVNANSQPASRVDFSFAPAADLRPFCQVAQRVASGDGCWRLQFPLFDAEPILHVSRVPGSQGALHLMLEDNIGSLFDGCVLEDGQAHSTHHLSRAPVAGYYGVLGSCANTEPFASVQLGRAPNVLWVDIEEGACRYLQLHETQSPLYVQVSQPLWFDPATLNSGETAVVPSLAQVLSDLQECLSSALQDGSGRAGEAHATESNKLRVQIQNLVAEREALSLRTLEVDRLAVQVQNLTSERDALLLRAQEADLLAVEVQNLTAERSALWLRVVETDRLAVQVQNLASERDALLVRAQEADRLLISMQNLAAERDALHERALEADRLAVQVQNLTSERDALLLRAWEADRLLISMQNLAAERDALHERALEADRLAVQLQNLTAERDALMQRALEADSLAVQLQILHPERDALSLQVQQQVETLQQQEMHFLQQISEVQAQQQETLGRLTEITVTNQHLNEQLCTNRARLAQLEQHLENRVGNAVRSGLASLVNKK